jgi:hypothetical protein
LYCIVENSYVPNGGKPKNSGETLKKDKDLLDIRFWGKPVWPDKYQNLGGLVYKYEIEE